MAPTWKTLIVTLALCLAFSSNNIFARFLSVDPVDPRAYLQEPYPNPMGFNRYAYGNNNPYRYVDPDGRIPIVVPLVFIGKEIVGEVFEQTTGIPAPTLKNAGKFAGKQLLKTAKRYMVKPTGLAQNRSLRNLTHQEIQKTFSGKEFLIGIKKVPEFGHVLVFGSGGTNVEVKKDVAFRICPVDKKDLKSMIRETKIGKKLPKKSRDILEDNLMAVCKLTQDYPKIKELDINPFTIVKGHGKVVDARMVF